jgi:hypothetical protein
MYKVIGADNREYGPISLEQLQKWISEGRINANTRVLPPGATEWKTLAEIPELSLLIHGASGQSGPVPAGISPAATFVSGPPKEGLATASLILGLLSFVCLIFAGIPAVICGHVARSRAKDSPQAYGGAGMALAGLIMGYIGIALSFVSILILPALFLPALGKAKGRAQSINCANNMKQIGLAYKIWAGEHNDQYPWNEPGTNGGTMELAVGGADSIDSNPMHFEVLSNELYSPILLRCPGDTNKTVAVSFKNLKAGNISYVLHTGTNVTDSSPQTVLCTCPIHGHALLCDGSVIQNRSPSRIGRQKTSGKSMGK